MSFVSAPQEPLSQLFTCLTCQVAFHTADRQRTHYRTDWHRYNLKRKVAELAPVTAEAFATKILAQKSQIEEAQNAVVARKDCIPCRKDFASENAYTNHLNSKKHLEKVANYVPKPKSEKKKVVKKKEKTETEADIENDETLTEEDKINKLIDKKLTKAVRLEENDCIFCTHKSADFDSNMLHMTEVHSFFIPDIEYLKDLRGLVKYLGEKVSIANVCLYCNGKGRELKSLTAVRNHMKIKGHNKIAYDDEIDIMEISDFYDFSTSYADHADCENPDEELNMRAQPGTGISLGSTEYELVLPSGARIGHRSLQRYYNQNLRPAEEQEARSLNRLVEYYNKNSSFRSQFETRGPRFTITQYNEQKEAAKNMFKDQNKGYHYSTRVGTNANRLQRYFREQIL